jgi:hypothetical protein
MLENSMQHLKVHKKVNPLLEAVKFKSTSEKEAAVEEVLKSMGLKTLGDIMVPYTEQEKNEGRVNLKFSAKSGTLAAEHIRLKSESQNVKLGVTGSDYLDGTSLITGVIEQVTPVVENEVIAKMFPEGEYSASKLFMDVWQPITGMTHANAMDAPVQVVKKRGFQTEEWLPPFYIEMAQFNQNEILNLRDPGNQNLAIRGIAAVIAKISDQLTHRGGTRRLNDIYNAIFTGSYIWQGESLSYGIPSGNRFTAGALNGVWGVISGTNYVPNPASNPILDMTVIVNNLLKKYRGLKQTWIMNPSTSALFSQNDTVINRVNTQYSDAIMQKAGTNPNSMKSVASYYLGADIDVDFLVDGSAYIADENDPNGYTAGTTNYILPDYQIWIKIETDKFGGPYGEYAYCLAAQNGGLQNARPGKFFQIIDSMASNTIQGITQPTIALMNGWRGGVRIPRYFDVYTFNVGI